MKLSKKTSADRRSFPPEKSEETAPPTPWVCHTCGKNNLATKKRCGSCQSWRGGTRKNITGKTKKTRESAKAKAPPPVQEEELLPLKSEKDEEQEEDADVSMGARLPKRKRKNLYSSLSPAVIQATAKAKAKAFASASPSPQLASKFHGKRKHSHDRRQDHIPDPTAIAIDTAARKGGTVPDEFIGQDGNLFYCRICLGVGEVVCCDGCPHVFHLSCLPTGPSKRSLENDDDPWFCHECVQNGKSTPSKKRRKTKERCSECQRKETKAHPCMPCAGRDCDEYFHIVCPGPDGEEVETGRVSRRLLCTSCKALRDSDRSNFEYDQDKLEQLQGDQGRLLRSRGHGGRGSRGGRGGRGGRSLRRMSSTEERMRRFKESDDQGLRAIRGRKRAYSSGYQSPYVELDEDDDDVGPELLAYVEQPLSPTPGFFFFLLHNRSHIERSLNRKNPTFRSMPRGCVKNEKVAEEGAAIWVGMSQKDQKEWVDVSMKDFEQRCVAWGEKEVIEAMIKTMSDGEKEAQGVTVPSEALPLPPEDDDNLAITRARVNQYSKAKAVPVKGSASSASNPILLELLNDARFRPLPLVSTTRAKEDLAHGAENKNMRIAVQQLNVQGPIETGLGDDCMGCTRGWSHYCSVMKRHLPSSEHRAKLQPPVSSFSATRVGLGLKINLPREDTQRKNAQRQKLLETNALRVANACPNYQPRHSFVLSAPSLRLDDTAAFIESAAAMKSMKPDIDASDVAIFHSYKENDSSSPGKSKSLARGLLPLRGRKKKMSADDNGQNEGDADSAELNKDGKAPMQRYCCTCGSVQSSAFGCMSCRKSQLVSQMAKRSHSSPNSVADDYLRKSISIDHPDYGDGFVKPLCTMLGRSSLNDVSASGRKKNFNGTLDKVSLSLTKESWQPNVIMPPIPKCLPTPKPINSNDAMSEDDESTSDESTTSGSTSSSGVVNGGQTWECTKCAHRNETSRTRCGSCQGWKGGKREHIKSSRPRSCHSKTAEAEVSEDRHALALKHKEDATELSRKCLERACCGILVGMIRRDPMRLFAEPVPADVAEYHDMIKDPIDFSTMRKKILASEYTSLKTFIADARRLCINACVFNAADSLYAKTAKTIYDSLEVMHDRAKKWTQMLKNSHAMSFLANDDGKGEGQVDTFKDVKLMWPGAVDLLEDYEWLKRQAASDFTRTKENEIAYFGTLAIQRAAGAAKASLLIVPDEGGVKHPVVKRSHIEDKQLRKHVDEEAARCVGPVQLKDEPDWREQQLLKLLKRVQKRRIEGRLSSESGCARCDGVKTSEETNMSVSMLRSKFKRTVDTTKARVANSRKAQSTGLASQTARERTEEKNIKINTPLELVGQVATESMVSVRGSKVHGWGLFADQPFKAGAVVAEYIGEYVSEAVADIREKRYREQRIQDYQFRVDRSLVIDATLRGGYARYINHSCSPNCIAKIVKGKAPNEHLKRVLIVSQRDIQASEELSYDYQFPLEMNLELRQVCDCRSKQCRGFMNWDIPEKSLGSVKVVTSGRGGGRRSSKSG